MELTTATVTLWTIWALLRFWVRERLLPRPSAALTGLALRTAVEQAIVLTLAGATALTAMLAIFWSASILGLANVSFVRWLLASIGQATDLISSWADNIGTSLMALFVVAAAVVWHLHARGITRSRLRHALQERVNELLREREENPDTWASLGANESMAEIDRVIAGLHEHWQAIERDLRLSDAERQAELESVRAQAERLFDVRLRIDVERRLGDFIPAPEPPTNWRERVLVGLASRGLIGDMQTAASYAGLLATALTIASMVGLAAGPVRAEALSRVNALELRVGRQAAEASLSDAAPTATTQEETPWTEQDEQALEQFARMVVHATFDSRGFPLPSQPGQSPVAIDPTSAPNAARPPPDEWVEPRDQWEHSRRDQIRRAILNSEAPKPASAELATDVARAVDSASDASRHDSAVSRVAEASRERLRVELRRRPTLFDAFRAHAARYQQVIQPVDLRSGMMSGLFGQVAGEANVPVELQRILMPIVEDTGEAVLNEYLRTQEMRALEALARGRSIDEALSAVRQAPEARVRFGRVTARAVADALPAEATREALEALEPAARPMGGGPSAEALRTATGLGSSIDDAPRASLEALATYDDYFPPRRGAENATSLGTLERNILSSRPTPGASVPSGEPGFSGGGGGGGSRADSRVDAQRVSYRRSRSFRMARGFARVGGVLIGRPPDRTANDTLTVTALDWSERGGNVEVRLGGTTLGPFQASTLDAALQYAADGRVTTVTMTSAAPLLELKILLHPSLEDTPLGADAIELDRFVDTYARRVPRVQNEEARILGQYSLYEAAWTLRQVATLEAIAAQDREAGAALERTRGELEQLLPSARTALVHRADLQNPRRSILAAKPAWFDQELVRRIASTSGEVEEWQKRLLDGFRADAVRALAGGGNSDEVRGWFEEPAKFQLWSGVRERRWTVGSALTMSPRDPGDALWPFEFMLQASFVTPPRYENDADDSPFEFTEVQADIQKAVLEGIHARAGVSVGHPQVVGRMREFTVLQRLFRLALSGQLGGTFPLERLPALASAVRPYRRSAPTLRWNVRPGALEAVFARVLTTTHLLAELGDEDDLANRLERCEARISVTLSQDTWDSVCRFGHDRVRLQRECTEGSVTCRLGSGLAQLELFTQARRLRLELGVEDDPALVAMRKRQVAR